MVSAAGQTPQRKVRAVFVVERLWPLPAVAATRRGELDMVRLLLEAGAAVDPRLDSLAALDWAAIAGDTTIAALLVAEGVSLGSGSAAAAGAAARARHHGHRQLADEIERLHAAGGRR